MHYKYLYDNFSHVFALSHVAESSFNLSFIEHSSVERLHGPILYPLKQLIGYLAPLWVSIIKKSIQQYAMECDIAQEHRHTWKGGITKYLNETYPERPLPEETTCLERPPTIVQVLLA